MKKKIEYIRNNKLIIFFWIYVVYGSFIYITNLGRILKYWNDDFFEEATVALPANVISILKNTVTGTTVLIWLIIWGIYFGKREKPRLIFSNNKIR